MTTDEEKAEKLFELWTQAAMVIIAGHLPSRRERIATALITTLPVSIAVRTADELIAALDLK